MNEQKDPCCPRIWKGSTAITQDLWTERTRQLKLARAEMARQASRPKKSVAGRIADGVYGALIVGMFLYIMWGITV